MLRPQHPLPQLHDLYKQLFRFLPSTLVPKCQRQISHAGQHIWMLPFQRHVAPLHCMHLQLFRLLPLALIPARLCKVAYAVQRV